MAGLAITITDVGRAALRNAQGTGTPAVTISQIGVSSVHTTANLKTLTALPSERKRLATFGGDVVAPDVFHVTIRDETAEVYTLRAFALYLSTGVLFAVCSSSTPIIEKSAGSMVLLAADVVPVGPGSVREMTPHVPPEARAAESRPTAVISPMRRPRRRRRRGGGGVDRAVA